MSLATDRKAIFLKLFQDDTLKTLMKIPTVDKNNLGKVRDLYITHSYGSDTIITNLNCRILFRNVPLTGTNNQYVKWDGIIFEIFVKNSEEYTVESDGLIRRQEAIADRLYELLARQYVASMKFEPVDRGDLYCGTEGYKRYFVKFTYKRIF